MNAGWNHFTLERAAQAYNMNEQEQIFHIESSAGSNDSSIVLTREEARELRFELERMDRSLEEKLRELGWCSSEEPTTPLFIPKEVFNPTLVGACVRLYGNWEDVKFDNRMNYLVASSYMDTLTVINAYGERLSLDIEAFKIQGDTWKMGPPVVMTIVK